MRCCPSQNTQTQGQGDAVVAGEGGGQGHHAVHNVSPVKMDFTHDLCPGVILVEDQHCLPLGDY